MPYMKKAFTILELLVVISILAILVAILIPRFKAMEQNSNLSKTAKELSTIEAALESYRTFDSSHNFPPSTTTLIATYLSVATPQIINTILYDPFAATSTTEYNYLCSTNSKYYLVYTVGIGGNFTPTGITNAGVIY
jgi:prepilin-type N-terminal cleavage/methylation domain-containing protein